MHITYQFQRYDGIKTTRTPKNNVRAFRSVNRILTEPPTVKDSDNAIIVVVKRWRQLSVAASIAF